MNHLYIYRKSKHLVLLPLLILYTVTISAQHNHAEVTKVNSFNTQGINESGIPINTSELEVGVSVGTIAAVTDETGMFPFLKKYPKDLTTASNNIAILENITLIDSIINLNDLNLLDTTREIPLPFTIEKKRYATGSTNIINSNQLEKYPSNDIRNALVGVVPGLQITENYGSPGFSAEEKLGRYGITEKIDVSARGRNMMYIIDNIPVDITEIAIDPWEIESVSVIKDILGRAMYGPMAADGIIFIKTKRGKKNEHIMNVYVEEGISMIDRMPEWVTGGDYAKLNNLARKNDKITPVYTDNDISAYEKNDPYDLYHPNINYQEMMFKDIRPFRRANLSSSGGDNFIRYSSYLGYNGEGDIYNIGPKSDYNRINANTNLDIRINDDIKVIADFSGNITIRRSANYGAPTGEGSSSMDLIELNSILSDVTRIPPNAFPVYANNDPSLKFPWYGVSSNYNVNPIGNLSSNGDYTETGRRGAAKFGLDYDFSRLVSGLKSQTFIGYDALNLIRLGHAENYIAYITTPTKNDVGNDTILFSKVHDGDIDPQLYRLHDHFYNRVAFHENISYERSFGIHNVKSTLTYLLYKKSLKGIKEPQRQQNGIWTISYTYKDKYIFQGLVNYAGTSNLQSEKRYKSFPSMGVGWILSDEPFLSNLKFLNFLKLRAQAGILGYDNFSNPFLYKDNWIGNTGVAFGPYSSNRWFGTTNQTVVRRAYPNRIGNIDLHWGTVKEINIGMDGLMFDKKLSLEINYYNKLHNDEVVLSNTLPYVYGLSSALPSVNFNAIKYYGLETGIQFASHLGEFTYSIGGNAAIQNSKYEKFNEPDYRYDYQSRQGRPVDAYTGFTYIGKFESDAEALKVPQLFDEVLKEGDLKYKDMNDDGFIDDNDASMIGHTSPRLFYALNTNLKYHNFEMTMVGIGSAFYDIPLTNSYFWSGWGDNNYSNFVRDNHSGKAYPRLTYNKVNNNFVRSDFWLAKGGYFKIKNIELAYNIPPNKLKIINSMGVRFFIRGANLLTISKIKDLDPESINAGVSSYPLNKIFTGGIKLTF